MLTTTRTDRLDGGRQRGADGCQGSEGAQGGNPDGTLTRKCLENRPCQGVRVVRVLPSRAHARAGALACPCALAHTLRAPAFPKTTSDNPDTLTSPENKGFCCQGSVRVPPRPTANPDNAGAHMLDPRTVPIARGLAPPVALQDAVRALSILLTGSPSSAPLDPPWRASYARWRADATRAAQALPRVTHAQRRLERAAWELLAAADAIAEAADA